MGLKPCRRFTALVFFTVKQPSLYHCMYHDVSISFVCAALGKMAGRVGLVLTGV